MAKKKERKARQQKVKEAYKNMSKNGTKKGSVFVRKRRVSARQVAESTGVGLRMADRDLIAAVGSAADRQRKFSSRKHQAIIRARNNAFANAFRRANGLH
jgi:flagellar biosynthesis/type III secretory pathway protein FliH